MSIGSVLDEAWTLFTRFFLRFFLIAVVVFATVNLVYARRRRALSSDNDGGSAFLRQSSGSQPRSSERPGSRARSSTPSRTLATDASTRRSGEVFVTVSRAVLPLLVAGLLGRPGRRLSGYSCWSSRGSTC